MISLQITNSQNIKKEKLIDRPFAEEHLKECETEIRLFSHNYGLQSKCILLYNFLILHIIILFNSDRIYSNQRPRGGEGEFKLSLYI